jgi:hypothetical protein
MRSGFLPLSIVPRGSVLGFSNRLNYVILEAAHSGASLNVGCRIYCGGWGRCAPGRVLAGQVRVSAGLAHSQCLGNILYRGGAIVRELGVAIGGWIIFSVNPSTIICNSYCFDFSYFACSALPRYPNPILLLTIQLSTTFIKIPEDGQWGQLPAQFDMSGYIS